MAPPEGLPKMEYRFLGRTGLQVSAISLGGWLTYGGHVENDLLGRAFGENPINNVGLSRKHIIEGVNASLERLDLAYVDLIYAHRPDRNTPMEETVRAFNHIIDTGKAFYWGTSEWNADEIASAWRVADRLGLIGPVMEQPLYNMISREKVEKEFEHLYDEIGLGLTTFSPLKIGILTGKYNDGIPKDSRLGSSEDDFVKYMNKKVGDETWKKDIETVRKLKPVADKLEISQANLALAWVLQNKRVNSAITGASKPEQIYESVKALVAVEKLTPEILKEIDDILGNKPAVMVRRF
ncbi:hypothetical protein G7Y89_g6171 [Cudoniella acicularis]|uniref:NADP-dependent oxidoreductase domain-containing protein n=1 Tax=Cudoniella acicularis TaxID=354080 RepID=A0A8H4RL22_9HELO|nr:hypothetical protein G7Y89_g6171 [Cudoniella acicularis]